MKKKLKVCRIFAFMPLHSEGKKTEHVQASTVWERFRRSWGVWCESLSRVCCHLGCSSDDKAQVQGPVIVGICVHARMCVWNQTDRKRPQPNTTPFIWPWLFLSDCPHSRKSSSAPPWTANVDSVLPLPLSLNGEKKGNKRCRSYRYLGSNTIFAPMHAFTLAVESPCHTSDFSPLKTLPFALVTRRHTRWPFYTKVSGNTRVLLADKNITHKVLQPCNYSCDASYFI